MGNDDIRERFRAADWPDGRVSIRKVHAGVTLGMMLTLLILAAIASYGCYLLVHFVVGELFSRLNVDGMMHQIGARKR